MVENEISEQILQTGKSRPRSRKFPAQLIVAQVSVGGTIRNPLRKWRENTYKVTRLIKEDQDSGNPPVYPPPYNDLFWII